MKVTEGCAMELRSQAVGMAKRAGSLLLENLGSARVVEYKGAIDLVTEMDKAAESLIVDAITKNFPGHGILTEERRELVTGSQYRWIIDPLDGTTNYSHGFPIFCVSIAVEENGEIILGVVYAPCLDELFVAEKGGGVFLNNKKVSVSKTSSLDRSLLATGFPYDVRTSSENNFKEFTAFALRAQAIRRAGAAALDLAYVGCGRFDGFWEMKLKAWDVAAASLIVKEAGGVVTDFKGEGFNIEDGYVLASNGLIHDEMLSVLALPQTEPRA